MKNLAVMAFGASGTCALFDFLYNNNHIFFSEDNSLRNKEPLCLQSNKNKDLQNGDVTWKEKIDNLITLSGEKIYLTHIKPWHLFNLNVSLAESFDYLKDKFDFIILKRRNYLATRCSSAFKNPEVRGLKANSTNVDISGNMHELYKDSIGYERKISDKIYGHYQFIHMDNVHDQMLNLAQRHNHICIEYEDHIKSNPRIGADIITKHFSIYHDYQYKQLRASANKNRWSDIKLCDKIKNFSEIKKELMGTKYEWMLWE